MSDLQCAARILLARPSVGADALARLADREHVARTITAERADEPVDLAEVADLHRGETVLVIADTGPHADRDRDLLLVEIDGDGWVLTELPALDSSPDLLG